MFRVILFFFCLLIISCFQDPVWSAKPAKKEVPKYPKLSDKVKKAEKIEGFFTLYRKDNNVYMEVPKDMFKKDFFMYTSLSKGTFGGMMLPHWTLSQQTLYFEKIGKSIVLFEKDTYHIAKKGSPISEAVNKAYLDRLKHNFRIIAANKSESKYLIDLNSYFFTAANTVIPSWYARYFGLQGVSPSGSFWSMVKNFPNNTELEVRNTIRMGGMGRYYGQSNQSFFYFSLVKKEKSDYKPRIADDRIGYFLQEKMDFSNQLVDRGRKRTINRWNVQKSDPDSKSSVVKKPIIFYLDKTIPYKYRQYVRAGILEWNKAFEKLGFVGAVEARLPDSSQNWDPSDVRYSTISWSAAEWGMAIGPSRTNPETGEIIDADIIISSGWINVMNRQANIYGPDAEGPTESDEGDNKNLLSGKSDIANSSLKVRLNFEKRYNDLRQKFIKHKVYFCDAHYELANRKNFAMMARKMAYKLDDKDFKAWKEKFIGLYLKELTMHEVGHTLGLRHNFKGSSVYSYKNLSDKEWSSKNQVTASIMDYNELYVAADPKNQGKYMNDTLGEYDYLAIEYGYKPIKKDENKKLDKIAASLRQKGLEFCTDEDKWTGNDPHCTTYDIGDDNVAYAKERIEVAKRLLQSAPSSLVTTGDRRFKLRQVVSSVLMEYYNASLKPLSYIGGTYANRDHVNDPEAKDAYIPVSYSKQKEVLDFLDQYVFIDPVIKIPKKLLASARTDSFLGEKNQPIDPDLYLLFLRKRSLTTLMSPKTMDGLRSHRNLTDNPMTSAEVFESAYKMAFKKLIKMDKGQKASLNTIDRHTHEHFVSMLKDLLRNPTYSSNLGVMPYVKHSARLLKELIDRQLKKMGSSDSFKLATNIEHLRALKDEIESAENAVLFKL